MFQELAVDDAAAFEDDPFDVEEGADLFHCVFEVVAVGACEEVGNVVFAQVGQVGLGDVFTQYGDDAGIHDGVRVVEDFAVRVEDDEFARGGGERQIGFGADGPGQAGVVEGFGAEVDLDGVAAEHVCFGGEPFADGVVGGEKDVAVFSVEGFAPAVAVQAAVDGTHHVTDDCWAHGVSPVVCSVGIIGTIRFSVSLLAGGAGRKREPGWRFFCCRL